MSKLLQILPVIAIIRVLTSFLLSYFDYSVMKPICANFFRKVNDGIKAIKKLLQTRHSEGNDSQGEQYHSSVMVIVNLFLKIQPPADDAAKKGNQSTAAVMNRSQQVSLQGMMPSLVGNDDGPRYSTIAANRAAGRLNVERKKRSAIAPTALFPNSDASTPTPPEKNDGEKKKKKPRMNGGQDSVDLLNDHGKTKEASIKMMHALTDSINKPSNDLALAKEKEKGNQIAELYMKNKADNNEQKNTLTRENNNIKNSLMREKFDHQRNAEKNLIRLKERKLTSDEQQNRIQSLQAEAKEAYSRYSEAKRENFDADVIQCHWDDWKSIKAQITEALK